MSMTILDRLERRFRRYSLANLTLHLIAVQVFTYLTAQVRPDILEFLQFVPAKVLRGELWRPFTFLFTPPLAHPILAFFFWYFFYLMGTALEVHWGTFRYNVYLFVGWIAAVAASFITPDIPASPGFLQGSVFLAFAFLYPDFVIYIFFLLPIRIKWLALLTWLGYLLAIIYGTWSARLMVCASVLNFFLFFGQRITARMKASHRRMVSQSGRLRKADEPFHRCTVCGITDRTHPDMDFRYCTKCVGQHGYCTEHIRNHEHIVAGQDAPAHSVAGEQGTRGNREESK